MSYPNFDSIGDGFNRVFRYNDEEEADDTPTEPETEDCESCGDPVVPDDIVEAFGQPRANRLQTARPVEVRICPNCSDDHYTECDDCDTLTHNNLITNNALTRSRRRFDYPVCQSCLDSSYHQCPDCDGWAHEDNMGGTNTADESVCDRCADNYGACDGCQDIFSNEDLDGDNYCEDCAEENQESDAIHEYRYAPKWVRHGDERERHFGVELETVLKEGDLHDAATETLDKLNDGLPEEGFAFLKEDGSLEGHGVGSFEIVTHPATLDVHRERWPAVLGKNAPDGLISHDADCCGLHIHVEKKGLTVATVGKILHFVNRDANRPFIEAIARRTSEGYARLDPKKTPASALKKSDSRYEAVNLLPSKTLEFRIFKGTLKPESFFRSLEFVDALVKFSREASLQDTLVEPFADFVAERRREYPELYPFVQKFLGREVEQPKPKPVKMARDIDSPVEMSVTLQFRPRQPSE